MRDDAQTLMHAVALCTMLLEALEGMSEPAASKELKAALREFCDQARSQLAAVAAN